MQYEILIKKGRKIVERHARGNYEDAMVLLNHLEDTMGENYTIEFQDKNPFSR